jgi:parallel beta-helix repeat protein
MNSKNSNVSGNVLRGNARDGIDTSSGIVDSVFSHNVSIGNTLQGFEMKGTAFKSVVIGTTASDLWTNGESLSFSPSGASATLLDYGGGALLIWPVTGTPANGDIVTGGTSGVTATQSGAVSSTDYSFHGNAISSNRALDNTNNGFTFQGARNCNLSGNHASGGSEKGFLFNDVQNFVCTGDMSSRNTKDGFEFSSVSRSAFIGLLAVDNSYDDGVTQNGTYHGFDLSSSADGNMFIGCRALNGTISGQQGGQGYAFSFDATSNLNYLLGCQLDYNVTGDTNDWTGQLYHGVADALSWYRDSNEVRSFSDGDTTPSVYLPRQTRPAQRSAILMTVMTVKKSQ